MSTREILEKRDALIDDFIAKVGGIILTIDGVEQPAQFPETDSWLAVHAVAGLWVRPIAVPGHEGSDYLHSRGEAGTQMENGEVPQSCRFTVLAGAMLWRQQWANNGQHIRLEAGQTAYLQPHEKHSYLFLEDCFCAVVVTPPFAHHTPRPLP